MVNTNGLLSIFNFFWQIISGILFDKIINQAQNDRNNCDNVTTAKKFKSYILQTLSVLKLIEFMKYSNAGLYEH
ncbi:unnamed protein product [Rhizophagus irregularis]|nr:unnamed protein product [Rhizophagus irregularis]